MNLVELTEYLVKQIVCDPDSVSVKQFDSDDEYITIEVLVSSDEIGYVIGKGGRVASSIRTIVQAAAYTNNLKKVKVNFDAF